MVLSTTSNAGSVSVAPSVETGASWFAAAIVLFIFTFSYGAPLVVVVSLKEVAAEFDNARSIPALAHALAWLGSGTGALAFGWVAERLGIRRTVSFGAVMLGSGLAVAALGGPAQLLIGHGFLLGVLGAGAINIGLPHVAIPGITLELRPLVASVWAGRSAA